jgi:hypothetical protein
MNDQYMAGLLAGMQQSGNMDPGMMGNSPEFLSGLYGMADVAGAEFLSGNDPVSALLGLSDINGADDMGFSVNPFHYLNKVNPFHYMHNPFAHKKAQHAAVVRNAINQKMIQNGAAVVDRQNQKARRFPSPVTATIVAGGAAATISAQPQTLFRPERFVVPGSLAPSFVMTDLKVGNVSQFPNPGELPLEIFAQNGFDVNITLDTVNPALNLSVSVINITGGALTFRAGFIGTSVQ